MLAQEGQQLSKYLAKGCGVDVLRAACEHEIEIEWRRVRDFACERESVACVSTKRMCEHL